MPVKKLSFIAILVIAAAIRFYQLGQNPPSLGWDEAAVGYNAYSILQTGKDEWGVPHPFLFKSFGEYKFPSHIYATTLSIKIFGINDFAVRFPSAFLGVINVLLLYLLIKEIFGKEKEWLAQISAASMTILPWHIHFSRIAWETNATLLFFIVGLWCFFKAINKSKLFLLLSLLLFGATLFTYNTARVFIPIFVFLLAITFCQKLWLIKKEVVISFLIFTAIFSYSFWQFNTTIGQARFSAVKISLGQISQTFTFQKTHQKYLGAAQLIGQNWLTHYSPNFLFQNGDSNSRHSQGQGELLWIYLPSLIAGLYFLIKKPSPTSFLFLLWFLIWPIPASIVNESPHASRAMFGILPLSIISALGFYQVLILIKTRKLQMIFCGLTLGLTLLTLLSYLRFYYQEGPIRYSADWQYGFREVADYTNKNEAQFDKIIVSSEYGQPYIFFLYYLKYNPENFWQTAKYNPENQWGFSTVASFGKFEFKKIDLNTENNSEGKLFVMAPNEWESVRNKTRFKMLREVDFLNKKPALFLVAQK